MTTRVVVLPVAQRDVDEHWFWLAPRALDAADRFLQRADEVYRLIAAAPLCGRARPDLSPGLRSFPMGQHVVFYRPLDGRIDVVRVLAATRDITPSLFD